MKIIRILKPYINPIPNQTMTMVKLNNEIEIFNYMLLIISTL